MSEYSRPHFPTEPYNHRRRNLLLLGHWDRYEDIPKSLRAFKDVCWGTVVTTPKYNRPL
jgi:hypothetical protein